MSRADHRLMILLVLAIVVSCTTARRRPNEPQPLVNLLPNGSFELDGRSSMEGWRESDTWDSFRISIVRQHSPDGGKFCLRLVHSGHEPRGSYVVADVTEVCPEGIYSLSASGKAPTPWGGGSAFIEVSPSTFSPSPDSTVLAFEDTMWTRSTDTFFVTPGVDDSVWVVLSATGRPPGPGYIEALFDDIVLEKLD